MPVKINMAKARGIHMDRIRAERDKRLAALDVPFMRAVETGDRGTQKRIEIQKQSLRDIPQTFDLTTDTPEALILMWPDNLERGEM